MKKLIVIIIALVFGFVSQAQTSLKSTAYPENVIDTVTNTATKTLYSSKVPFAKVATIQFTGTKISGTVAGTATLKGSIDGTNWYAIGSAFTLTDVASQTTYWKVTDVGDSYYQISVTGSGTMAAKIASKLLVR